MTLNQANSKPKAGVNYSQLWGMEEAGKESAQDYIQRNPDDFFVRLGHILEEDNVEEKKIEVPEENQETEEGESKFSAQGEIIFQKVESYTQTEVVEPASAPQAAQTQESLNQILHSTSEYTIKATENVLSFTGGMMIESGGAFMDLFNIVTGREKDQNKSKGKERPGEDPKGSEKLKQEQFNIQAHVWNQELQTAQAREAQITEAKEEARSGVVGSSEQLAQAAGMQAGYEKVKNIYTRSFIAVKKAWDNLKAQKNQKPVYIAGKRAAGKGSDIRIDKAAEGGRLSNTGGAGVG